MITKNVFVGKSLGNTLSRLARVSQSNWVDYKARWTLATLIDYSPKASHRKPSCRLDVSYHEKIVYVKICING